MTDPRSLEAAAAELKITVDHLNRSVQDANDVKDQLTDLINKSKFNRKLTIAVAVSAAFNLLILIVLSFTLIQLDTVVQTQKNSALCPLYKLFIDADTPQNRERAVSQGQDPEERTRQFSIIRKSYKALNCESN